MIGGAQTMCPLLEPGDRVLRPGQRKCSPSGKLGLWDQKMEWKASQWQGTGIGGGEASLLLAQEETWMGRSGPV